MVKDIAKNFELYSFSKVLLPTIFIVVDNIDESE